MHGVLTVAALWSSLALAAADPAAARSARLAGAADFPAASAAASAIPATISASPAGEVKLPASAHRDELTHWGVLLDAGVPDGVGLAGVFRPWYFLRVNAGPTYNTFGYGVRAGASLIPFYFPITPSLNFDVGHYFEGDATHGLVPLVPASSPASPILQHLSYTYANLHLGLEAGSPKHFTFFLRAGLSYLGTSLKGFGAVVQSASGGSSITASDPSLTAILPSAKLGFIVQF